MDNSGTPILESILFKKCDSIVTNPKMRLCSYLYDSNASYLHIKERLEKKSIDPLTLDYSEHLISDTLKMIVIDSKAIDEFATAHNWDRSYEGFNIPDEISKWSLKGTSKMKEIFRSEYEVGLIDNQILAYEYDYYMDNHRLQIAKFMQRSFLLKLHKPILEALKTSKSPIVNLSILAKNKQSEAVVRKMILRHKKLNTWAAGHRQMLIQILFKKELFVRMNPTSNRKLSRSFVTKRLNNEFDLGMAKALMEKSKEENIQNALFRKKLERQFEREIDKLLKS